MFAKFIFGPLSNEVTRGFILVIAALFVVALYRSFKQYKAPLDRQAPTILTTLGVIGTFVGIYVGLVDFNVEDIDGSIPSLLAGLKVAFSTSIAGMGASVLLKFLQGLFGGATAKDTVTAGDLHRVLSTLHTETQAASAENQKLLNAVKAAIAGEGDGSLITQIQKLRTTNQDLQTQVKDSITAGFGSLTGEFQSFAEKMAENNSKALIEALREVITDFNAKINEQFGDNFKQLNEAVAALLTWQDNYKDHVETLVREFDAVKNGITDVEAATSKIATETQAIPATLDSLKSLIEALDTQIHDLHGHLEAVAALKDKAVTAFPVIEDNVKTLTTNMTQTVQENVVFIHEAFKQQSTAVTEAVQKSSSALEDSQVLHKEALAKLTTGMQDIPQKVDNLVSDLTTQLARSVDTFNDNLKQMTEQQSEALTGVQKTLQGTVDKVLEETAEGIQNTFTTFDESMQEEVKRAIESMGSHLASLSKKLVEDYGSLTQSVKDSARLAPVGGK